MSDPPGAAVPKRIDDLGQAAILASKVRLAASPLWDLQRTFYERQGARAWSDDVVPHYITCNPAIADAYALATMAFLRDCARAGRLGAGERVHVVEVGSGSGRFAYLFLRRLRELLEASELAEVPVTVVLTDFERSKLEVLRSHPWLQGWLEEGVVDLALFDAAAPAALDLLVAGRRLGGSGTGPVIAVANYVFDSLPAEALAVSGGQLHDCLMTITSARPGASLAEPDDLDALELAWELAPLDGGLPALDPTLAEVARAYEACLDDTVFLLPTAAVGCLRHLREMAGDRPFLALVADKGHPRVEDLLSCGPPSVVTHGGCFSLMVNFDALARVVVSDGGTALLPRHRPANLVTAAYAHPGGIDLRELERCVSDHLEAPGPDDTFALRALLRPGAVEMDLDQVLAHLRVSRWDSAVFLEWFSPLLDLVAAAPANRRPDIAAAVDRVWEGYFPIGEKADVALCCGLVLSAINHYPEAIGYLHRSLDLHGPAANTHFALAIAHYGLRDLDTAAKHAREALALDPGFSGARSVLTTIDGERARAPR